MLSANGTMFYWQRLEAFLLARWWIRHLVLGALQLHTRRWFAGRVAPALKLCFEFINFLWRFIWSALVGALSAA